jgi:hypothetical protein
MAQRIFHATNWSAVAFADTFNLVSAQYMALKGGSTTQRIMVTEINIAGLASATAPCIMQWARVSTIEAGAITALASPNSDGPKSPATADLAATPKTFVAAATNGPQRSAATTDAKLDLAFNAFGGISRWNVPWQEAWELLGNTASFGESVLSAFTGSTTASVSAHIVYEPL